MNIHNNLKSSKDKRKQVNKKKETKQEIATKFLNTKSKVSVLDSHKDSIRKKNWRQRRVTEGIKLNKLTTASNIKSINSNKHSKEIKGRKHPSKRIQSNSSKDKQVGRIAVQNKENYSLNYCHPDQWVSILYIHLF